MIEFIRIKNFLVHFILKLQKGQCRESYKNSSLVNETLYYSQGLCLQKKSINSVETWLSILLCKEWQKCLKKKTRVTMVSSLNPLTGIISLARNFYNSKIEG